MTSYSHSTAPSMKKSFFSVIADKGGYDDASRNTVFITDNELAARAYVNYHNTVLASMRLKVIQSNVVGEAWEKVNPKPAFPPTAPGTSLAIPKWDGLVVTSEMRLERKRLTIENDRRTSETLRPLREWALARMAAIANWQTANLTVAEQLAKKDNVNEYEFEEVSWMPPLESLLPADALTEFNAATDDALNDSLGM